VRAAFATPLARIAQLLRQRRENRGREKIYALHAPEVECIGRGKARTRLEFRCKVSLATTNRPAPGGQFVLGARTLPGNPFDGHTLAAEIAQTERITGVTIERASVDRGDRGHDAQDRRSGEAHQSRVFVSGQRRGVTPTIRREIKRRAGIEPVIGHMKADGHLGRNFLAGAAGDAINLVLAAAGHNLRLLRAWLARLLAFLLSLFAISATVPPLPSPWLAAR
jgi:IS5 family transposase